MNTLNNKWVLILGGKAELVIKAKAIGLNVLLLQKRTHLDPEQLKLADHIVITDLENTENLISIARGLHTAIPFSTALSLSENYLIAAAKIRHALSLPGTALETTQLLKNKSAMRQKLAEAHLSPVSAEIGETLDDIRQFLRKCKQPIIVKPINGAGSLNISRINTYAATEKIWMRLKKGECIPFLMEEYLDGQEVSVEAFSFNGKHIVINVTDKMVGSNFVEIGHTMPSQLDASKINEIEKFTCDFLTVVGLTDGPSHTEIKLTSQGLRIIESHDRVGGDHINELIHTVYGIDMKQMTFAWLYNLIEPLSAPPPAQCAAAIRFFTPPPGIVKSIRGYEEVARSQDVVMSELQLNPGDIVKPLSSSGDRPGFFMIRGRNVASTMKRANQLMNKLHISLLWSYS